MAYQIYRIYQTDCTSTTAYAELQPGLYETSAYAAKKAEQMSIAVYDETFGEENFVAVKVGGSPWHSRVYTPSYLARLDDDIPF